MITPKQITDEMVDELERTLGYSLYDWEAADQYQIIAEAANLVLRRMGIDADLGSTKLNPMTENRVSFEQLKEVRDALREVDDDKAFYEIHK